MKRSLFFLPLLFFGQYTYSQQHELRVYRNVSTLGFLSSMCIGTVGMYISGAIFLNEVSTKGLRNIDPVLSIPSAIGLGCSYALLNSYLKWFGKRNKPILVFDEEGFTYEKPMGWFRSRQDVRYLWKDVISHWVSSVLAGYGTETKKTWNYHIEGEKDIVTINALELNIPKKLIVKVESLRQGRVRALLT